MLKIFNYFCFRKPIEGKCLEVALAKCTYKSRLLLKKLLYDFARIHLNVHFSTAPQGSTGKELAFLKNILLKNF